MPGAGLLGSDFTVHTPDGRRLRAMTSGDGEDLVILEAGLGASGLYWGPVHERIATRARVVAYDRAGYGGSDPDPAVRDLERLAADLDAVIDTVPHRRLVLVGHSWGGPVVRVVAARRRQSGTPVTGLVLVEQSDEHADLYFTRAFGLQSALQDLLSAPLARVGVTRLVNRAMVSELEEPLRSAAVAASSTPSAVRATRAENAHVHDGLRRLRDKPPELGDLPVHVISGRRVGRIERAGRDALSRAHRTTAERLERGRYIEAHNSGHLVPVTEPDLVATAALTLLP